MKGVSQDGQSPQSLEKKSSITENPKHKTTTTQTTHCPRLKLLDSSGDTDGGQETRGRLFASSGPLNKEAPHIRLHANQQGQIPTTCEICHIHGQSSLHLHRPLLLHLLVFGV